MRDSDFPYARPTQAPRPKCALIEGKRAEKQIDKNILRQARPQVLPVRGVSGGSSGPRTSGGAPWTRPDVWGGPRTSLPGHLEDGAALNRALLEFRV